MINYIYSRVKILPIALIAALIIVIDFYILFGSLASMGSGSALTVESVIIGAKRVFWLAFLAAILNPKDTTAFGLMCLKGAIILIYLFAIVVIIMLFREKGWDTNNRNGVTYKDLFIIVYYVVLSVGYAVADIYREFAQGFSSFLEISRSTGKEILIILMQLLFFGFYRLIQLASLRFKSAVYLRVDSIMAKHGSEKPENEVDCNDKQLW